MADLIIDHKHPRRDFSSVTLLGMKALNLALTHQAVIEPRLPKDMLTVLNNDITSLGGVRTDKMRAQGTAKQATEVQNDAAERARARIRAIRKIVRAAKAPTVVQHAYGIGAVLRPNPTSVKNAITQILDRLKDHPGEMDTFGFQTEDVEGLKTALLEVTVTDFTQDQTRAKAPLATRARNEVANRILHAAQRIGAAGTLAFAEKPAELALFEALTKAATQSRKKRETSEEAPEETTPEAPTPEAPTPEAPTPEAPPQQPEQA